MKSKVEIDAGVCGFCTTVCAQSDNGQNVTFEIESGCQKIEEFSRVLQEKSPIDAYAEMSPGQDGVILSAADTAVSGCCKGCIVPLGLFKAMQVAAGLALPKDVTLKIVKED
ncbi:hypothetical protein SMSP2_00350 [Limihaloglobus sulfuriphilus]|uniref:Uncharacterized protein n=1 Tax=Limihaloglobus sulfuriphilus TaxID=1851148 RepID=A0A1Q2MBB5_9BACT|nr:hypothetical protein [Limihaloglobus sulfuriphilus]AQQ70013.1 hypothetical protein SMSP2_00350 [Limihaloglobus sulfuriphilus]